MALDLFYFLSTLPTLRAGEKPPFTYEEFLAQCAQSLPADMAAKLNVLRIVPGEGSASDESQARWFAFETYLRNVLAELRMNKFPRGSIQSRAHETDFLSPGIRKQLEDAMALSAPLEREEAIDKVRWNFLEELKSCHSFDFTTLAVYSLQLQLLEKQTSRDAARGGEVFQAILEKGLEQATESRVCEQER